MNGKATRSWFRFLPRIKLASMTCLEAILLVAESKEIFANPKGEVFGSVIEAEIDKTKGVQATLLVQNGPWKLAISSLPVKLPAVSAPCSISAASTSAKLDHPLLCKSWD